MPQAAAAGGVDEVVALPQMAGESTAALARRAAPMSGYLLIRVGETRYGVRPVGRG